MVPATLSSMAEAKRLSWRRPDRLLLWTFVASIAFVCYILGHQGTGVGSVLLRVIGAGSCGWAWLVSRALFDPAERESTWALIIAGVIGLAGAVSALEPGGLGGRVAGNAYALSGSAALTLTLAEPFVRWRREPSIAERRFRVGFAGLYATLMALSVLGLWANQSPANAHEDIVEIGCAMIALAAMWVAVTVRRRLPLRTTTRPRRPPTAQDVLLAGKLTHLVEFEDLATRADLRIGDVATRLGHPEHHVSQSIAVALGFANFNRWINHHRIAKAKALLTDPGDRRSILEIAFACGFASLGPFNRAFRDETGTTPRAFRTLYRSVAPKGS